MTAKFERHLRGYVQRIIPLKEERKVCYASPGSVTCYDAVKWDHVGICFAAYTRRRAPVNAEPGAKGSYRQSNSHGLLEAISLSFCSVANGRRDPAYRGFSALAHQEAPSLAAEANIEQAEVAELETRLEQCFRMLPSSGSSHIWPDWLLRGPSHPCWIPSSTRADSSVSTSRPWLAGFHAYRSWAGCPSARFVADSCEILSIRGHCSLKGRSIVRSQDGTGSGFSINVRHSRRLA